MPGPVLSPPPCPPGYLARGTGSRSVRLAAHLAGWLASGQVRSGARLPTVRAAAARYGLDKATVAKSYRDLIRRGLLVRRGRGTRAGLAVPEARGLPCLPRTILVVDIWMSHLRLDPDEPQGSPHRILHSLAAYCQTRGWSVLLSAAPQALGQLALFNPSAIITIQAGNRASEIQQLAAERSIPLIAYGDVFAAPGCDRVCADHAEGVRQLVRELARIGRRRIAQMQLNSSEPWAAERRRGYREAMAACRLRPPAPLQLAMDSGWRDPSLPLLRRSQILAGELASILTSPSPPDAILAPSDGEALLLGSAIRLFNRRVPEDIAIVGYDDYWETSPELGQGAPAPLLTVDKDNAAIGNALAELAVARADGATSAEPRCISIAPRLRHVPPAGRIRTTAASRR